MYFVSWATASLLSISAEPTTEAQREEDDDHMNTVIGCMVVAVLLGWPFVGLLALPMAPLLLLRFPFLRLVLVTLQYIALVAVPQVLFEFLLYGRLTFPPLNIVLYNVLGVGGDSTLYGTEPWWFYLANLSLNFNLSMPLSLLFPPLHLLLCSASSLPLSSALRYILALSPLYLWLAFFSAQPHKEERFIFAVYPLLAVTAGLALDHGLHFVVTVTKHVIGERSARAFAAVVGIGVLAASVLLSAARTMLVIDGFSAPGVVWREVASQIATHRRSYGLVDLPLRVCVGKEWYRFPSHFYLPGHVNDDASGGRFALSFLASDFDGQLPAHIAVTPSALPPKGGGLTGLRNRLADRLARIVTAARTVNDKFNSWNQQDTSSLAREDECHFIVDLSTPNQAEKHYEKSPDWEVVLSKPFLDTTASRFPYKSLYLPVLSPRHNSYNQYLLLRSKSRVAPRD